MAQERMRRPRSALVGFIIYSVAALFVLMALAHMYVAVTFYDFNRGSDWPHILHHFLSGGVEIAAAVWMCLVVPGASSGLVMSVIFAHAISSPTELRTITKRDFDSGGFSRVVAKGR